MNQFHVVSQIISPEEGQIAYRAMKNLLPLDPKNVKFVKTSSNQKTSSTIENGIRQRIWTDKVTTEKSLIFNMKTHLRQ